MNRKIVISEIERTQIVSALMAYEFNALAHAINFRYVAADPTDDGPEVEILQRKS